MEERVVFAFPLFGRTCQLGCGYDAHLDEFVELKDEPENIQEEKHDEINVKCSIISFADLLLLVNCLLIYLGP